MLIIAQQISYTLPTRETLFSDIHFTLNRNDKTAIIGHNGAGKSTLLKILAGQLTPQSGSIHTTGNIYYVPQHFGQYNSCTVAEALGIQRRYGALKAILNGYTEEHHFDALEDDWELISRCEQAFAKWHIAAISPDQSFTSLSGGEKTKVFLAGIDILQPQCVLMDEPTNHLDSAARQQYYEWIIQTPLTLLTASHDRQLLELCNPIWELQPGGIHAYGGNYTFYTQQKALELAAQQQQLAHAAKTIRVARQRQQEAAERQQRENSRGERNRKKGGIPKILLNGLRNKAENTTAKIREVHAEKVSGLQTELDKISDMEQLTRLMKGHFAQPPGHTGKILVKAEGINYTHANGKQLWPSPLDLIISSGDRFAITGANGSGKSTLIKLIMGAAQVSAGTLYTAPVNSLLLDQNYSIIDRTQTVLSQAQAFNETLLEEHLVKTVLVRFLFEKDKWEQSCATLSGGEMLRLALCCMTLKSQAPDMIILDEPTNNLDIANIRMLTQIFADYRGTLIVVSHDAIFREEVGITQTFNI